MDNISNYHSKYMKYKSKYMSQKNKMIGGHAEIIDFDNTDIHVPIKFQTTNKFAFVFCLFGTKSQYVHGTLPSCYILNKIREKSNYKYDIIVLCTKDVLKEGNEKFISHFTDFIIIAPYLQYETFISPHIIKTKAHYTKVWFKFHIYRLINYQKVCLLDGDYLVSNNLNFPEIFDKNTPLGIFETPGQTIHCDRLSKNIELLYDNITIELIILYNILLFKTNICNIKQDCNHKYGGFNASILLIEPSIDDFNFLINILETNKESKDIVLYYPEQQLLTLLYCVLCPVIDDEKSFVQKTLLNFTETNDDYKLLIFRLIKCQFDCFTKDLFCNISSIVTDNVTNYIKDNFIHDIKDYQNKLYAKTDVNKFNLKNKCWIVPILDENYYITEYYTSNFKKYLDDDPQILGYPILQQTKLWSVAQNIISANNDNFGAIESYGGYEWFVTYHNMYMDNKDFIDNLKDDDIKKMIKNILEVYKKIVGKKNDLYLY